MEPLPEENIKRIIGDKVYTYQCVAVEQVPKDTLLNEALKTHPLSRYLTNFQVSHADEFLTHFFSHSTDIGSPEDCANAAITHAFLEGDSRHRH